MKNLKLHKTNTLKNNNVTTLQSIVEFITCIDPEIASTFETVLEREPFLRNPDTESNHKKQKQLDLKI